MYDVSLGRFLQRDPAGLPGGMDLYVGLNDSPINATDPSGLWVWQLDATGRVVAVAEQGDTLADLQKFGYKVPNDVQVKAGVRVDLTENLPAAVRTLLKEQQTMPLTEEVLRFLEGRNPKKDAKTFGECGVDPAVGKIADEAKGTIVIWNGYVWGMGQCYGFVGVYVGVEPPKGVTPKHFSLYPIKGEPSFPGAEGTPGKSEATNIPAIGGLVGSYSPKEGLENFFKGKGATDRPTFGDIAVFRRDKEITHAAIVVGVSRSGVVYILQKMNQCHPYSVSNVTSESLQEFGKPEYYRRK